MVKINWCKWFHNWRRFIMAHEHSVFTLRECKRCKRTELKLNDESDGTWVEVNQIDWSRWEKYWFEQAKETTMDQIIKEAWEGKK
jgi:hypothetical protein